ncbi:MAG: beta-phosphoglucomutase family hydrolase [Jiangellales bacterium]
MPTPVAITEIDAVLFDLDGVLTTTRTVHAAAWKDTFDAFLTDWDAQHETSTAPFNEVDDYVAHVDGKPRQDGVRDFLASRGIELPEGEPHASRDEVSVWGLSNRKQELVESELERLGVEVFPGSIAWVREVREAGLRTAVVSSSRNCASVLEYAGITNLFDERVDGATALELGLPGKPAPDMFLEAARRLGVSPERSVVIEDALSGVEAGKAGGFRYVIAVDRDGHADALTAAGADLVVDDLSELLSPPDEQVHRAGPPEHRLLAAAKRILAASGDYPTDPWRLVERGYNPEFVGQTETLFAVSNGYLGIRGAFEEEMPSFQPGTLLNGFHETWPIAYPEKAHGYATTGQTILPVPDGTSMRLFVDEDPINATTTEVLEFERALDMQRGALDRSVIYQLHDGRRFWVRTKRFVSLTNRHLACLRYQVTALDAQSRLVVSSDLVTSPRMDQGLPHDQRRSRSFGDDVLTPMGDNTDGPRVVRSFQTKQSGMTVAAGMDHEFGDHVHYVDTKVDDDRARVVFGIDAPVNETVTIYKWMAYHYGKDEAADLRYRAEASIVRARSAGYREVFDAHTSAMAEFWQRSDVEWDGYPAAQQAMRFSLFSVLQASIRAEGHGAPAKGLTGTGYEGHYFWDTEVYVLPFLIHTNPPVARSLLMHRVHMLDDARRRARDIGQAGALFPWRTISGDEASAYYAAGTAQYHIDADISYALDQYVRMTGDDELMLRHGAELLVETARMWADIGFFSDRHGGRYVIQKVTGPDEYTTVVDNNLFTNLMAAENLALAVQVVEKLRDEAPADYKRLVERTDLAPDEIDLWRQCADLIYVPYDSTEQVHLQDEGFLDLEPWDFAGTPPEKYPLLLNYHPLIIYRHQVIKQADVELATVMLPGRFTAAERERIFEMYDPLTTGDSSLSESIQAIAAADVGKYRTAEEYLIDAMSVDMADTAGNVRDGVHVASAGGSWMSLVFGFGGFRWRQGDITFRPMLPTRARRLRFPMMVRGNRLRVDIEPHVVTYTLETGERMDLRHYDQPFTVTAGSPATFEGDFHTRDADGR